MEEIVTAMLRIFLFSACLIFTISACNDPDSLTSVIQDKQEYTIEDQKVIGDAMATAMKTDAQTFDILNANAFPEVSHYLNTMLNSAVISEHVLNRPSSGTEEVGFDWEIITMVDEASYAYSMPGGKLVLSTGLLKTLQYESELLALLSNEIYFTDIDVHTEALKDEYSGIRLGNIALGNTDNEIAELIYFLKDQSFTEDQMMAADRRTVAVMCPFNYDVTSLMSLIERSQGQSGWHTQRPRPQNWQEMLFIEFENCANTSTERFRSRYEEMISTLP